jgi:potassium efflux system protein
LQLSVADQATLYVRCVSFGLMSAATIWLSLEIPRQVLRRGGLVAAHLGAPADAVRALWIPLRWLTMLAVPLVFLIQVFEVRAEDAWRESAGRFAFVVLLAVVALFTHVILRERVGALWRMVDGESELTVRPLAMRAVHLLLMASLVSLIVAGIRGYYWTALQLAQNIHFTLVFVFLLLVAFLFFLRWSLVARRRVAFERLRIAEAARAGSAGDVAPADEGDPLDLGMADAQTTRLLKSAAFVSLLIGLWVIWVDLVPATGILRRVELWDTTRNVSVAVTNAAGETRFVEQDRIEPVTLANVLLAVLIAVLSLVTVRNLPGVLEITVLRNLGSGVRYAYATIAKYGVGVVGLVLAFDAVGVGWSNIQWLVAAVGLGLGFGLQEIFANFISGMIILFERPIRVGDTVTVGDVSGVVSRIRIRATWITQFDRKELVVPNKDFVTTRLINWSLSDSVLRVNIPVGVAYGSDTDKVIEVLHRVARETAHVLPVPPPDVLFLGFGDSALNFELRVFSPDVEHRLKIVHALHLGIDHAFRAEGIEIAFPQRDVHLKSFVPPLPAARA